TASQVQIQSIDPVAGTSQLHVPPHLFSYFPATTSIFASDYSSIVELDANFTELGRTFTPGPPIMGTLDSDAVWFESIPLDDMKRTAGRIDAVRWNHGGEVWREPVATDSELVNVPVCHPAGCNAAPGNA